jgi:hypothetical protein
MFAQQKLSAFPNPQLRSRQARIIDDKHKKAAMIAAMNISMGIKRRTRV